MKRYKLVNKYVVLSIIFVLLTGCYQEKKILKYINKGDYKKVSKFLDSGVDIDKKYISSYSDLLEFSPLEKSVFTGNTKMVKILLQAGADPSVKSLYSQKSPLHYALEENYTEIVELLIENGADIALEDFNGETPIYGAIENKSYNLVKILIEKGTDVNYVAPEYYSPLRLACRKSTIEIVQLLIDAGADVNYVSSNGKLTALSDAIISNSKDKIELLLKSGAQIDLITKSSTSLLESVYFDNNFDLMRFLLEKGADPWLGNEVDDSQIYNFLKYNETDLVLELIPYGSDIQYNQFIKVYEYSEKRKFSEVVEALKEIPKNRIVGERI